MRRLAPTAALVLLAGAACQESLPQDSGLDEPVRVPAGFFIAGELPVATTGPRVTSVEASNAIALLGQDGRALGGRAGEAAWAMGLRFATLGSGWWIHEVGDLAPLFPEERDFLVTYDLGAGIPPGLHALRIAAIDEDGRRGPVVDLDLCVLDDAVPAGLTPCDPSIPPPAVVLGVTWNREVDLDLVVDAPGGRRISWKAPTSATPVDGTVPDDALDDPSLGRLSRDSNAGCIADGRNAEAVVWDEPPADGVYSAYVDLFDACGEPDVSFTVSVYRRREQPDGTLRLEETERRRGTLVAQFDAYGGAKPPLFVVGVELP